MALATQERTNQILESLLAHVCADERSLGEQIVEWRRAMDWMDLRLTGLVDEFADELSYRNDGYANADAWMVGNTKAARGEATLRCRHAALLREFPLFAAALLAGLTGPNHLAVLAKFVEGRRLAVAREHEELLVGWAKTLDADQFRVVMLNWASKCDDLLNDPTDMDRIAAARKFNLHQLPDGSWSVSGHLEPTTGEALHAALREVQGKPDPEDERTPERRRHDAFDTLVRSLAECSTRPGTRAHVTVTVNAESGEAFTGGGVPLPEWLRDTLVCDCMATTVWMNKSGVPFDIGTPKSPIPERTRRAVIARDFSCRYAGCNMSAMYCDVHHLVHRANKGCNNLDNLGLFCRFHHRLIHRLNPKVTFENDGITIVIEYPTGRVVRGPPQPTHTPVAAQRTAPCHRRRTTPTRAHSRPLNSRGAGQSFLVG